MDFLKGVAQPLGGALVTLARRRLGQAKFDASFGLAEAFDRHADHQDCIRTHQQPQIAKQLCLADRCVGGTIIDGNLVRFGFAAQALAASLPLMGAQDIPLDVAQDGGRFPVEPLMVISSFWLSV